MSGRRGDVTFSSARHIDTPLTTVAGTRAPQTGFTGASVSVETFPTPTRPSAANSLGLRRKPEELTQGEWDRTAALLRLSLRSDSLTTTRGGWKQQQHHAFANMWSRV